MKKFEAQLKESILNPKAQKFIDDAVKKRGEKPNKYHDEVFGDKQNIVVPLGDGQHHRKIDTSQIHHSINETLAKYGYGIHDYVNNVAVRLKKNPDGSIREEKPKISTILAREKDGVALKHFNDDKQRASRTSSDHEIVISRDPQKVGRMTSSREWCGEHCTRLPGPELKYPERTSHISDRDIDSGGLFYHHIEDDIKHDTLIAYLVKKGDNNVEAPLGRILLKKHIAIDKDGKPLAGHKPIWKPELYHDFGHSPENFKSTVKEWADKNYPALQGKEKAVQYKKQEGLYDDAPEGTSSSFIHRAKGLHRVNNTEFHINDKSEIHDPIDGSPAKVTQKPLDFIREEHYQNGVPHRDSEGPQERVTTFGATKKYKSKEVWRQNGFVHRDGDKPALIERKNEDAIPTYTHMKCDLKHRDTKFGPAVYSGTENRYLMNGIEHRPASEGPSHVDKYGNFSHKEFGRFVNPPTGGPSVATDKLGTKHYTWAETEHSPEAIVSGDRKKLALSHKDGTIESFSNNVHTTVDTEGKVTKEPMADHHKKVFDDFIERSKTVPEFKRNQPPA